MGTITYTSYDYRKLSNNILKVSRKVWSPESAQVQSMVAFTAHGQGH